MVHRDSLPECQTASKKSLFLLIFLAILSSVLPAESETDRAFWLVDSSLTRLDMTRSDLWMPWDAVPDDTHRLTIVKDLFAEPLNTVTFTRSQSSLLESGIGNYLMEQRFLITERLLDPEYIDSLFSLPPAIIFKPESSFLTKQLHTVKRNLAALVPSRKLSNRYVSEEVLELIDAAKETRARINRYMASRNPDSISIITEQADSMLLMSEESKDLTVYELKAAEKKGDRIARQFFETAAAFDLNGILVPSLDLLDTVLSLLDSLTMRREINTRTFHTDEGDIRIGGSGDDIHQGNFSIIIDFGGNDSYIIPDRGKNDLLSNPVQMIIDLKGDDNYFGGDYALSGAFFGCSILVDREGDDHYTGGNFTLGSGLFGLGIHVDEAGNDTYIGKTCTEGSGAFGIGLLIDREGSDLFQSHAQSQGFGFTRGSGTLADDNGNDVYVTTSPYQDFLRYEAHFVAFTQGAGLGYRPYASGGLGFLFDYAGNDSYQSDIYGQGTAYWYSIGAMLDARGDDSYKAYQYAQGSGVHMAHAVLLDDAGNDHYFSHGVSQGCGHDIAFGGIFDRQGDDEYVAESLSQGGGNADAVSILVDEMGDDAYIARSPQNMMGYSDFRREYGMIGIFADGGGNDLYGSEEGNSSIRTQSTYGIFADLDLFEEIEILSDKPLLTPPDSLQVPLSSTADSLFTQASAAPQKFQYNVQPARDRLIAAGGIVVPYLMGKLASESARERHALTAILKGMLSGSDSSLVADQLVDSLLSSRSSVAGMAAHMVGLKKITGGLPNLLVLMSNNDWRIRAAAIHNLGKLSVPEVIPAIAPYLNDPRPHVRMRTSYALGRIDPQGSASYIPMIMSDSSQLVRNSYFQGVKRSEKTIRFPFFIRAYQSASQRTQGQMLQIIPYIEEEDKTVNLFRDWIAYQPPGTIATIREIVNGSQSDFWKDLINSLPDQDNISSENSTEIQETENDLQ